MDPIDFFTQIQAMYEAPGNDPPDVNQTQEEDNTPPDISEEETADESPPDVSGDDGGDMNDIPPDIGGDEFDDQYANDDTSSDNAQDLKLNEKISALLNEQLYQRYLSLINNINGEIAKTQENSDVLNIISKDSLNIIDELKKLDENLNLYIKNNFMNSDYSKNRLFFNKCINLLQLLNITFGIDINKGIKAI